ncbi:MAG: haloacid dehalogenase-like hydrolase [Nanoarchaeota archaeon]|nr:haloacid dehalogenase-like hydrolase [Nanoarchaeota archaeon]
MYLGLPLNAVENKRRIDVIIKKLISKYKRNYAGVLVIFDFDELLVEGHLSSTITELFGKTEERNRIISQHGDSTFDGMKEMNLILKGYSYGELIEKKREIVRKMPWREGAEDLLKKLYEAPGYELLILSCGRYIPQHLKLMDLGLSDVLVAGEMEFVDGKAEQNKHIVTDEMKGYIVRRLKNSRIFREIYVAAHGDGDVPMLKGAFGVVLNPSENAKEAAQREIKHLDEMYEIIGLRKE